MRTPADPDRVPPALGWYRRTYIDEPATHANTTEWGRVGEETPTGQWGELYWRDGFRSAYLFARRARGWWRGGVWLRCRPVPSSTYRRRPRRARRT